MRTTNNIIYIRQWRWGSQKPTAFYPNSNTKANIDTKRKKKNNDNNNRGKPWENNAVEMAMLFFRHTDERHIEHTIRHSYYGVLRVYLFHCQNTNKIQ